MAIVKPLLRVLLIIALILVSGILAIGALLSLANGTWFLAIILAALLAAIWYGRGYIQRRTSEEEDGGY